MKFNETFTFIEILSLLGLFQSLYVFVYMFFRSGSWRNMIIPSLYFAFLSFAFLFDAAERRWHLETVYYQDVQWFFWFSGIPLGTLLVFQLAKVTEAVKPRYFLVLLAVPLALMPGIVLRDYDVLYICGLVIGSLALLAIWIRRDLLDGLYKSPKFGEERFWLVLALIALNTAFLCATLGYVSRLIDDEIWTLTRTLLGISFVYIAGTSLFRIYPHAFTPKPSEVPALMSEADEKILGMLKKLLEEDKVYQEASYGRSDLARELGIGEANLSRIVNVYFAKTIPQMLNELRVRDASRLLQETDVPIQSVFEESGFNSITTFNRVFKEMTGDSPKEYRARVRQ